MLQYRIELTLSSIVQNILFAYKQDLIWCSCVIWYLTILVYVFEYVFESSVRVCIQVYAFKYVPRYSSIVYI